MNMKMTYDDIKASPLGKKDASLEEIAMWLELNSICNATGVKCLMSCIEKNYQSKHDRFDNGQNSLMTMLASLHEGYASSRILKNLFSVIFKLDVFRNSMKDIKALADFSMKKAMKIKDRCKKIRNDTNLHSRAFHSFELSRLYNLFEVYAEMNDRLEAMLTTMLDDAR